MDIDQNEVRIAVVVIIEKPQPPTTQHLGRRPNFSGLVSKYHVFLVVIETKKLAIDVGYKQILPAIAIVVCRVYAHPRARLACLTESHPGCQALLFKFSVTT